jgi:DNA-directed RNA polymerase specialized sigma24 family protein
MTVSSADPLTISDAALLRRFIEQRDEAAFTELAQRYVRLVYSAALRRVGDRHLAENVCQAVFFILSKKARSAARINPLSASLLKTVKYMAANAMKIEARRQRREKQAGQAIPRPSARNAKRARRPLAGIIRHEGAKCTKEDTKKKNSGEPRIRNSWISPEKHCGAAARARRNGLSPQGSFSPQSTRGARRNRTRKDCSRERRPRVWQTANLLCNSHPCLYRCAFRVLRGE